MCSWYTAKTISVYSAHCSSHVLPVQGAWLYQSPVAASDYVLGCASSKGNMHERERERGRERERKRERERSSPPKVSAEE